MDLHLAALKCTHPNVCHTWSVSDTMTWEKPVTERLLHHCLHEESGIGKFTEIERRSEGTEDRKEDVDSGRNGTGFLTCRHPGCLHCRCTCCPRADDTLTAAKISNSILYVLYHNLLQKAIHVYYNFPCLQVVAFHSGQVPFPLWPTLRCPRVAENPAELGDFIASWIWALPLAFLGVWCPN